MPVEKIIQCGYMSGDTYTAAALLKLDPLIRILLIKDTRGLGAHADKSGSIRKIYQETGVLSQVDAMLVSGVPVELNDASINHR